MQRYYDLLTAIAATLLVCALAIGVWWLFKLVEAMP